MHDCVKTQTTYYPYDVMMLWCYLCVKIIGVCRLRNKLFTKTNYLTLYGIVAAALEAGRNGMLAELLTDNKPIHQAEMHWMWIPSLLISGVYHLMTPDESYKALASDLPCHSTDFERIACAKLFTTDGYECLTCQSEMMWCVPIWMNTMSIAQRALGCWECNCIEYFINCRWINMFSHAESCGEVRFALSLHTLPRSNLSYVGRSGCLADEHRSLRLSSFVHF